VRLFVAVAAPVAGVRDPHVTLCFLGEVADDVVPDVEAALRAALAGVGPCEAALLAGRARRLGPTALVRPVEGLDHLAAVVRGAVGAYAARPEERPFRGPLTVGRRRRGEPVPSTAYPAQRWPVDVVELVRSELGAGAGGTARHTVVAAVVLGPGG
jgi:2'-5' RNA ligase